MKVYSLQLLRLLFTYLSIVALTFTLAGCGSMSSQFFSDSSATGISITQLQEISTSVDTIRNKAASGSAEHLIYTPHPIQPILNEASLALRGLAKNIDGSSSFDIDLMLSKPNYNEGYLNVRLPGGVEQWKIIAFKNLGSYDGNNFEFTYLVVNPAGEILSLVVLGAEYKLEESAFLAYEGTLMKPGPELNWAQSNRAYKIDFGYQMPLTTVYETKIKKAEKDAQQIGLLISRMRTIEQNISKKEAEINSLFEKLNTTSQADVLELEIEQARADMRELRSSLESSKPECEKKIIALINLRQNISNEYKSFIQSNQYTWLPAKDQNDYFSRWKKVDGVDKTLRQHIESSKPFISNFTGIEKAYGELTMLIASNNNLGTDPIAKEGK